METLSWGLLGPEGLSSQRRSRTLGLGAVLRSFNDRAVPGLGGVWFGKQLFLATLGVAVAQQVQGMRVRNIEVANAIEALACLLAYDENGWEKDPRLRGLTKLREKGSDLSFAAIRRPSFYVTQPMRRATVQALPDLDLVQSDGPRFNSFRLGSPQENAGNESSIGMRFIDAVCGDCKPHNKKIVPFLAEWVRGSNKDVKTFPLREALSPVKKMSALACNLLRGRFALDQRRENALQWVHDVRVNGNQSIPVKEKPSQLDDDHWRDLCAGTHFFATRAAAIDLLIKIEEHIASTSGNSMKVDDFGQFEEELTSLRKNAHEFLDGQYAAEPGATRFCEECKDRSAENVLRKLIERDDRVLRVIGNEIELTSSFRGQRAALDNSERNTEDEGAEENAPLELPFPEHMSPRISNLYYLNLDLRGQLSKELK